LPGIGPGAPTFEILPNTFTIHSTTSSVILMRVPGEPTSLITNRRR
jgi:hypothetical protein